MGSLKGHVLPGTFFICFALWWVIITFVRWHVAARNSTAARGKKIGNFRNSTTQRCDCLPSRFGGNLPLEGIIKLVCTAVGMVGEINAGFVNGKYIGTNNSQHATMFFFFGLSGIVDLLHHWQIIISPNLDYLCLALAYAVEGLLFAFHQHGASMLEAHLHQLLVIAIFCCFVTTIVEMRFPYHLAASLSRSFFTLVQGTWFCHIGFVLYPPTASLDLHWNLVSANDMMLTTLSFAWHLAADLLLISAIGLAVRLTIRSSCYHKNKDVRKQILYDNIDSTPPDSETELAVFDTP